jgi:hypothetical protein
VTVSPGLASKLVASGFSIWASKLSGLRFVGRAIKSTGE